MVMEQVYAEGTAIQIIENLGNKKFKDHGIFPLVEDGIPNRLDLDSDGDYDLYLAAKTH